MAKGDLQLYVDTLIVATILQDETSSSSSSLIKNAEESGFIGSLIEKVKSYVAGKITPGHEAESVIDILTPGIFMALGFPIISILIKIAEMGFGLSPGKIFMGAVDKIKSFITSGSVSSEQVDNAVKSSLQENYGSDPTEADLPRFGVKATIRDAQFIKIAISDITLAYLEDTSSIEKRAGILSSVLRLVGLKHKTSSILGTVFGWIIKAVLASAGFMILGDAANSLLGRHDKPPSPSGFPTLSPTQISLPSSTQTTFKVNPNYQEEKLNFATGWIETVPPDQIGDQISQWTQNIYPDLKGEDALIKSDPGFQKIVSIIKEYNGRNTSSMTFMPKAFHSRKVVVDLFIDGLASKSGGPSLLPNSLPGQQSPSIQAKNKPIKTNKLV